MRDVNSTVLSGRLTRDPELRALQSGTSVCNLSLAVNENYKENDEWKERPNYIDITIWGKQGENASKYLSKGSQVTVQGRLTQRSWEDDNGNKRSKVEVTAEVVIFPPRPKEDEGAKPARESWEEEKFPWDE